MGAYLVLGISSGVVYGLLALGLVLIYKGSRVFNFAHGEFGTVAMYVLFFGLSHRWPYPLAALAALAAATLLGLATERLVARRLAGSAPVIALVGTAGVALLAIGLDLFFFQPEVRTVPPAFAGRGLPLLGFVVSRQRLATVVALLAIAGAAAWFFRRTYLGTAILAGSQDAFAVRVVGARVERISAFTWGLAGLLGGAAGILLAPEISFYPGYMTTIVLIPAFTAAVVGGMTSLPGAFVAGPLIGLLEGLGQYLVTQNASLRAIPEGSTVLTFLLLVAALLIRPRGLFGSEA